MGNNILNMGPATLTKDGIIEAYKRMKDNSDWIQAFLDANLDRRASTPGSSTPEYQSNEASYAVERALGKSGAAEAFDEETQIAANLEKLTKILWRATPRIKPEHARKHGIVSLSLKLFLALWEAGARSGIEYNHKKDAMHFEVRPELDSAQNRKSKAQGA
jgi:hypothetical protein